MTVVGPGRGQRLVLAALVLLAGCSVPLGGSGAPVPSSASAPGEPTGATDAPLTRFRCPEAMQPGPSPDLSISNHRSAPQNVTVTVVRVGSANDSTDRFDRSYTVPREDTVEVRTLPSWDVARNSADYQLTVAMAGGSSVTRTYAELDGDVVHVRVDPGGVTVSAPNIAPVTLTCTPRPTLTTPG